MVRQQKAEVMVPGRWYPTAPGSDTQWVALCGNCLKVRDAVQLELYRRPFGRGEVWRCKGGCR